PRSAIFSTWPFFEDEGVVISSFYGKRATTRKRFFKKSRGEMRKGFPCPKKFRYRRLTQSLVCRPRQCFPKRRRSRKAYVPHAMAALCSRKDARCAMVAAGAAASNKTSKRSIFHNN